MKNTGFMDIKEAAEFLKISPRTLYGWIRRDKMGLPVRDHGRRKVFWPDELKAWSDLQNGIIDHIARSESA